MPQAHASLRTIKKKLVRKALDAIKKLADDEAACQDAKDKGGEQEGEQAAPSKEACEAYATFWPQFGRALKLGILEDDNNRWGGRRQPPGPARGNGGACAHPCGCACCAYCAARVRPHLIDARAAAGAAWPSCCACARPSLATRPCRCRSMCRA